MCEACALRKMNEDADLQASALLTMLLDRFEMDVDQYGAVELRASLNPTESDWLCAWGAANEDVEDDDAAEEDMPPEESENLESDSRIRFGAGEGTTVALHQPTSFSDGDRVFSKIDRDGRPAKVLGVVASWRYESMTSTIYQTIQPDDGSRPFEVDESHVRSRSGHRRPRAKPIRE